MALFLVIAPLALAPTIQYLYVLAFLVVGALIYIPFVQYKWRVPGLSAINKFAIDKLNLVETEYSPDNK